MGLPGTLYGAVLDASGNGIDGAAVQAKAGSVTINITPLPGGYYFTQVPGGTYTVSCSKPGYVTQGFEGVVVPPLGYKTQNFIMSK